MALTPRSNPDLVGTPASAATAPSSNSAKRKKAKQRAPEIAPPRTFLEMIRFWRENTELVFVYLVVLCGMAIACSAIIRYMLKHW